MGCVCWGGVYRGVFVRMRMETGCKGELTTFALQKPRGERLSTSYPGCSFRREIDDLLKTSHAPRCRVGRSPRSGSSRAFL